MPGESAALVQKVVGTDTTDDKQHMLLKLAMAAGEELTLAVPQAEIGNMLEAVALGLKRGEATGPGVAKGTFPVTWWELGVETQTGHFVLSLSLGNGAVLRFLLQDPMPEHIHETPGTMLGKSTPQKPKTPLI